MNRQFRICTALLFLAYVLSWAASFLCHYITGNFPSAIDAIIIFIIKNINNIRQNCNHPKLG